MNFRKDITPTITIADQPTAADLEALKGEGYLGVVNVRKPGEPDQPLDPEAEGEAVRALGLEYLHHGIGPAPLGPDEVTRVSTFLGEHGGGKVLVHCKQGGRAGMIVLLHLARSEGWTPDEALAKGKALGIDLGPGQQAMVQQYLRQHAG